MTEPTCSPRDAASVIFNLPDYHVIEVVDLPLGGRRVVVQADSVGDGCPECGVVSQLVHAWCRQQRVADIPHAGHLEVIVVKPRVVCPEPACPRRTFTQTTEELSLRSRCTTRLRAALLTAVVDQGHGHRRAQVPQGALVSEPRHRLLAAYRALDGLSGSERTADFAGLRCF